LPFALPRSFASSARASSFSCFTAIGLLKLCAWLFASSALPLPLPFAFPAIVAPAPTIMASTSAPIVSARKYFLMLDLPLWFVE